MGRIGVMLSGFERALVNRLHTAQATIAVAELRLATGRRIQRAADAPSDFVALDRLRANLTRVTAASANIAAANTLAAGVRQTLDEVRDQLDLIRAKAVEDEDAALSDDERAANQAAIDAAVAEIERLATSEIAGRRALDGSAGFVTRGVQPSQISRLDVYRMGNGSTQLQPAAPAELVYLGYDGKLAANATVILAGSNGAETFEFHTAQTLDAAASAVNQQSAETGVRATVDGNRLYLRSTSYGAAAIVDLEVALGAFAVSGGDGAGHATGVDGQSAAAATIQGSVTSAAERATLAYTGSSGQTTAAALFTLSGRRGAAEISVANAESLSAVRDRINGASHKTGVVASVAGDVLTFESIDYGLAATVGVDVSSGTLSVIGGDGAGYDTGADVAATVNGRAFAGSTTARPATLVHATAAGTIAASATLSLTGTIGTDVVAVSAGQTVAQVRDAINLITATTGIAAEVDGNDLVLSSTSAGASALVTVEVTSGTFAVAAGDGEDLTGYQPRRAAQLIHVEPSGAFTAAANITLTGSLGSVAIDIGAHASLAGVRDLINARSDETGVVASVSDNALYLTSVNNGSSAEVGVSVDFGSFDTLGGDGLGADLGANAKTTIHGADANESHLVSGNRIAVSDNRLRFDIEFAADFSGDFGPITVDGGALEFAVSTNLADRATLPLAGVQPSRLGGVSGLLSELASGGAAAGLASNASRVIRIVDEALARLTMLDGVVDGFADSAVDASADWMSGLSDVLDDSIDEIDRVDEAEEQLVIARNEVLVDYAASAILLWSSQRMSLVDLVRRLAGWTT